MVFSHVSQIETALPAIASALQQPWAPVSDEHFVTIKIATRELASFIRSSDVESSRWSTVTRIAWSAAPLVQQLLVARRGADPRQALVSVVRELPGVIASIGLADRTGPVSMTVSDLLAIVERFETPEVLWIQSAIRAALRREDLSSLAAVPVAVESTVMRLAALDARRTL